MGKTAILIDGAFYNKRMTSICGKKSPQDRANELFNYAVKHLTNKNRMITGARPSYDFDELYRIFYYDCEPSSKKVFHPLHGKTVDLGKTPQFQWQTEFLKELASKRKVALRKGEILESSQGYLLKNQTIKKLMKGEKTIEELEENDFFLDVQQKGVDMRIGLDISSMAHKKQVDKIILISGDSDFVPAAKYARREGIDFVLDPLWNPIRPALNEHIDGLSSKIRQSKKN